MKKTYVLDTNVFLTDAKSIFSFNNNDIVIPLKVLEEIDKHKKRQDGVGLNARASIRILDELREKGNLHKGIRLGKGKGILSVKMYDPEMMPLGLDETNADNQIVTTALTEKRDNPKRKVIVISRDINMRIKCDALMIPSEDYIEDQVVSNVQELYEGFKSHLVDDQIVDRFYAGEDITDEDIEGVFSPNQYIMLISNSNPKHTALAKFINTNTPLKKINEYKNKGIWGLRARNKEQAFALDMLMNTDIPVISMIGAAGCGKTLLAIAAGLDQVLEQNIYKKLVVSRPVQPLGKDIGFLPGTLEEKMHPWLMPVQDNLEFLMGDRKDTMALMMEQGTIEIEALTYIRGRSISNAFVIIDEAQNLTVHELKTIVTRIGENSKIILTGDIEQIDNTYIDATSNGLSYAIEKFKEHEIAGHITLQKGERSRVATLASKIL
jgi:PhoH-like ATPase